VKRVTTATIVLTMIVKNESHVLERCVSGVLPLIDSWCIIDTGSTDGTQELAQRLLGHLPGQVFEVPWQDFAYNRSKALELARPFGDFSLMIDADVQCVLEPRFAPDAFRAVLVDDVYDVTLIDRGIEYTRPLLSSTRLPFSYRGVLHEFLDIPVGATHGGRMAEFRYESFFDGARSRNPRKFLDDAELLERTLASDADPDLIPRYTFYLAQSYRDAGLDEQAAENYQRRAEMTSGWIEEAFVSWRWCGELWHRLGRDLPAVLDAYARAFELMPTRSESLCLAATAAREAGRMPLAYLYARAGVDIPQPDTGLFIDLSVFDWKLTYELSVSAWYVKRFDEGRTASLALLANPRVPDDIRRSIEDNLRFYADVTHVTDY
jgi:glycosyltransferase involved in cell wall biosynthesis